MNDNPVYPRVFVLVNDPDALYVKISNKGGRPVYHFTSGRTNHVAYITEESFERFSHYIELSPHEACLL